MNDNSMYLLLSCVTLFPLFLVSCRAFSFRSHFADQPTSSSSLPAACRARAQLQQTAKRTDRANDSSQS